MVLLTGLALTLQQQAHNMYVHNHTTLCLGSFVGFHAWQQPSTYMMMHPPCCSTY
jgi:hypothetical protein